MRINLRIPASIDDGTRTRMVGRGKKRKRKGGCATRIVTSTLRIVPLDNVLYVVSSRRRGNFRNATERLIRIYSFVS